MRSVFVATPAYDGKVVSRYLKSIMESHEVCRQMGIEMQVKVLGGMCYVAMARNQLASMFMASECTDLFFIDADMGWDYRGFAKVLMSDKEFIGGCYPKKIEKEEYAGTIEIKEVTPAGLIQSCGIPTGFMRLKRSVIEKMIAAYPELKYEDSNCPETYNLFECVMEDGLWYGEDIYFCKRWERLGGEIWIEPDVDFSHDGIKTWEGNLHEHLLRLPGGSKFGLGKYGDNNIIGWTSKKELQWLYETAQQMDSVIEVGSFLGRSAHAIASGCKGWVKTVDNYQGVPNHKADMAKVAVMCQENLKEFNNLEMVKADSISAAEHLPDADMVFLDGDHSYETVKAEIDAWLPKTRKILCGHDYREDYMPGVSKAVDEKFGNAVKTKGNIWWVNVPEVCNDFK